MVNANEKFETDFNKDISKLLALSVLFPILNRTMQDFSFKLGSGFDAGILLYAILVFLTAIYLFNYRRIIYRKFIFCYVTFFLIFFANYLIFEETRIYYEEYFGYLRRIFLIFIPVAIMVSQISDFKYFLKYMKPISFIAIIIGTIGTLFNILPYWERLTFSTYLLPFPLFLYYHFRRSPKLLTFIFFCLGTTLILIYGGRMNFLSIILYVIIYEILNSYYINGKIGIVKTSFLVFFGIILFYSWNYILIFIKYFVTVFNISSRTIDMILSNEIFSFETRSPIYNFVKYELSSLGFGMYGIFGDRYVLREYGSWITYAHNIVYEILLSFGFILGTIVILLLFFKIIKGIFKGELTRRNVVIIFFCLVITRLWVSGSFIIEDNFYLMLGILWSRVNMSITNEKWYFNQKLS